MKTTAQDYSWLNDLSISEAGCLTVVPAADRQEALAAFGVLDGTARSFESLEAAVNGTERLPEQWVYVVEVGDALVLLEDNGYQGARPEVLRPASKASGTHKAAAFFWNVEGMTDFSAARRGKMQCSVELIGAEPEDLDGVPRALRRLVLEGGSEEGDLLGAGGALVAAYTEVIFREEQLVGGTFYELEPPTSSLESYQPGFSDIFGLPGAAECVSALPPAVQRRLAEWLTIAAARESGVHDEPSVKRVLEALGTGQPPTLAPALDALARRAAKAAADFSRLEDDLEMGGIKMPEHPYYQATANGHFGEHSAISHLEGQYLWQRNWAVETVRHATHVDPLSAALGCLQNAHQAFSCGRTTRGWLFEKDDRGRRRTGIEPDPRTLQFRHVVSALLDRLVLADGDVPDDIWVEAHHGLPAPLTGEERAEAIHADAQAAVEGEFATYQIVSSAEFDRDQTDFYAGAVMTETIASHDEWDGLDDDGVPTEFLAEQLKHLELALTIATAPQQFLDLVQGAESRDACFSSLREAFGFDTAQALQALYTPVMNLTPFGLADLRAQHDRAAADLNARQEGPQD